MRNKLLMGLAIIVTCILGAWYFMTHYSLRSIERSIPPQHEAQSNEFLAISRFWNAHHITVGKVRGITDLYALPSNAVLLYNHDTYSETPQLRQALTQWVKAGGYLVIGGVQPDYDDDDHDYTNYVDDPQSNNSVADIDLVTALGISAQYVRSVTIADHNNRWSKQPKKQPKLTNWSDDERDSSVRSRCYDRHQYQRFNRFEQTIEQRQNSHDLAMCLFRASTAKMRVQMPNSAQQLVVYLDKTVQLTHPHAEFIISQHNAKPLVHFALDKGWVSAFSDFEFMQNQYDFNPVQLADHAEFALKVVSMQGQRPVFIYAQEPLSFAKWLYENASLLLIAIFVFIGLWLWMIVPRFGAIAPDLPPIRRRLKEHLTVVGRYLWRHQGGTQLLEAARATLWKRILRIYPEAHSEQADMLLAQRFGVSEHAITQIRLPQKAVQVTQFISHIRLYQRIHKQITIERGSA